MNALLKDTIRATAFMMVPVVAFLAILSAVALYAVPHPTQTPTTTTAAEGETPQVAPTVQNARAAVRPNKI